MIKQGSKVTIEYELTVDGEQVDSSADAGEPFSFVLGNEEVIAGLEENLIGLNTGEKRSLIISPEKGYGEYDDDSIQKVARESFDDDQGLKVGDIIAGEIGDDPFQATILEINDTEVLLDLNHPLAGKTLHFDISIVSVE